MSFLNHSESNTDYLREFFPTFRGPKIQRYFGDHWCMHLPFAYELMRELKPKTFVELGVWKGESYFTFCQSVAENHLDTKCFGIDTWAGDIHMGSFGSDLGDEVESHHRQYSAFSRLKKMQFQDAVKDFADNSIHLLHIDGGHRYEDIKEDFDMWLPKVADGGIVLFHDVAVHDRGFGVWKFWSEIARPGASFLFTFGHGLGVWKKGVPSDQDPDLLKKLFRADAKEQEAINLHYLSSGVALQLWWNANRLQASVESKDAEIARLQADFKSKDAETSHLKHEIHLALTFSNEQKQKNKKLKRALTSAVQWQQRSWLTRAFHKWRVPGSGNKKKAGLFRKLERSIRKRRKLLLSKLRSLNPNFEPIRFGLILHLQNTKPGQLKKILKAISNQSYQNWHLWVLDEGSDKIKTLNILQSYQKLDCRITVLSGTFDSTKLDFPTIPPQIKADYLALLPETSVMPEGFLAARSIEIQGLDQSEQSDPFSDYAARFFVREETGITHPKIDSPRVRAIAFFLPQFHAIPENDAWWGKGFTEWTNVKRAYPLFPGHDQPRVPHPDVGYYNLLDAEVKERQADMARRYGLHGFCYYFYWFGGKRVLETPVEQILHSGKPDFPFCLCWANENWSRRWDGSDHELLLTQCHSPEDDVAMIRCVIEYFRDQRYIRVNGKPLFVVYRLDILPNPRETFARWRQVCREEGIGEIFLCAVQTFSIGGPGDTGVDAMIQFPPHVFNGLQLGMIPPAEVNADPSYTGSLFHFDDFSAGYLADTDKPFKLFRGVMPSWDNTPRRLKASIIVHGSSIKKYYWWLHQAVLQTEAMFEKDERLVFINAWNEWAEGTYLEPDTTHGYKTLEVTRRALHFPVPAGWHEVLNGRQSHHPAHEAR